MARAVLILFIVLFSLQVYSQDTINNFVFVDGDLYWQKIYSTELSFEDLIEHIQESGLIDGIEVAEDKVIGSMKPIQADYKGAGYSEMSIPMYVPRHIYTGFVKVEFKEGRYRVTLQDILLTKRYDDGISEQGTEMELEFFALSNGKLSKNFKKKPSIILNYTFTKEFGFKAITDDKDW